MNTGFLGPAVATVLTVYGIETMQALTQTVMNRMLQQCLPFTVLKHVICNETLDTFSSCNSAYRLRY